MLNQSKNAKFYLQAKLGQRGAEMVEYALVLACVCAVGAVVYAVNGTDANTLRTVINSLWESISGSTDSAIGATNTPG
mgnify:CR=1 FL=1